MLRRYLLLLLALCFTLSIAKAGEQRFNDISFSPLPQLTVGATEGLSAPFTGTIGEQVFVLGGCNFPDTPAAEGGTKVFYKDIYRLSSAPSGHLIWEKTGELPKPRAYGVSVCVNDGIICVGGTTDGKKSERNVYIIQSAAGEQISIHHLPDLPIGLDQMAGAFGGGYLYIAAGVSNGIGSRKAFRLKYPDTSKGWETLPDVPCEMRVQPCAAIQNGPTSPLFCLFGGYDPESLSTCNYGLTLNLKTMEWQPTTCQPAALVGSTALSSGCGHVFCLGGVNKEVFEAAIRKTQPTAEEQAAYLSHPKEWYRFNADLLVYSTFTDSWCTLPGSPRLAKAGAGTAIVQQGGGFPHWVIINGEEKPGIRSAEVTDVKLTYTAHFGWLNWTVLLLYLAAMLGLGVFFMKRQKSGEDFFKGGGRIPWWAAGISIFATMLSAITYMSIPAKAYATDWTYYPMQICILIVSFPVIKYYLPFFRRLNVTTAYEYLERRFSYAMRLMASLLFIVFMVLRMALVLFLPSLAMTAVTGINIYLCIILMAIITIVYCTMGGVEAVVWGDVVQGFILVGGAVLAAVYLMSHTGGGMQGFFNIAAENDKFRLFNWSLDWRSATFWVIIIGGLANNLISYTSDQTVIQRYLTTKDERSAARGILTNGLMSVFVTIAFFSIGTGLYTFFKTHPMAMDFTMQKTDAIFPFFMMSQLPAGVAGLLIAAVFAATMSTIASNINSVATAFTVDIYKKFHPHCSDSRQLRIARLMGIVSGQIGMLVAILMAMADIQSLLDYFNTILGLLSGGIGALFLMGIFFDRIGSTAAIIGFLSGTLTVFLLHFYSSVSFLLFGAINLAVSVIVALGYSLIFPQQKKQEGLTWKQLGTPSPLS